MRKSSILVVLTAFGLALPATPALAAEPCALSATTLTLTFEATYGNFRLYLDAAFTFKLEYDLNGVTTTHACGSAARDAVTNVTVNGDAGRNQLILDIGDAGGPFNANTIFSVSLGDELDYFGVFGTEGNDLFRYGHYKPAGGTFTLDWDNDGIPDVDIFNTEIVGAFGFGGADTMTGAAGGNFGASSIPIDFYGHEGNDMLTGGLGIDFFFGDAGRDKMWGGRGNDRMLGEAGADRMWGQGGKDKLWGGPARDRLFGGGGADKLFGQGGADGLFGGGGSDRCNGGPGADSQMSCEFGVEY